MPRASITACLWQCAQPCWKAARLEPPSLRADVKSPSAGGVRGASHSLVTKITASPRDRACVHKHACLRAPNGLVLQVEIRAVKPLEMILEREWQGW